MTGLTGSGFDIKTLDQILSDVESKELAGISQSLDLQPTDPIGVLNGVFGDEVFALWQLGAALYDGMDPDEAVADQLTGLALLTGTVRAPATKTQVVGVTVNVNAGTYLAGTMFASVVGTNNVNQFVNKADVVNAGPSAGNFTVDFEAVNTGPIQCLGSTLTVIAQPLVGWNSVTNPTAGTIGSNVENDADLRLRRTQELSAAGSSTASAIKGDVLQQMQPTTTTSATTACTVLYNDSNLTDANGLPPHSIEVIAYQPGNTADDDTALATLILNQKAAGIGTYGTASKTVADSQGNNETIYYTRPASTTVDVVITVDVPASFPSSDSAIEDAISAAYAAYANGPNGFDGEFQPGVSVYYKAMQSVVFPNPAVPGSGVAGVLDVSSLTLNGGTSNISIDVRHVATLGTVTPTINRV